MEELMSAGERKQRIIASIIEDFSLKPRLNNDRGTAILVAASIYDACHYYRLFQNTPFGPYCGIVTSYEPNHNAISREPPNSDEICDRQWRHYSAMFRDYHFASQPVGQ